LTNRLFLLFVYGVVAASVVTDVLKVSVGMLRPNFIAVCQPNVTCATPEEFGVYHTDYVCQVTGNNSRQ
jgi:phosphatidate phosphatase